MKLRKLKAEDAPLMLEWMHDPSVTQYMQTDFSKKTLSDCQAFIRSSFSSSNQHFALVSDDSDLYLGTVSLKNIENERAEFAITIRKQAMGSGLAAEGMRAIIQYGFENLNLKTVYWCVSPLNQRAVRFYNKNGYRQVPAPLQAAGYSPEQCANYIWYEVNSDLSSDKGAL